MNWKAFLLGCALAAANGALMFAKASSNQPVAALATVVLTLIAVFSPQPNKGAQ